MSRTFNDVEDSFLSGRARFMEWQQRFEQRFFTPVGELMGGALMDSIPQEQQEMIRAMMEMERGEIAPQEVDDGGY